MRARCGGGGAARLLRPSLALAAAAGGGAFHYEHPPCSGDEVKGEILGTSGFICSPRCDGSYNCPTDSSAASAQPQCMLQDSSSNALCALVCQTDSQCPTGGRCQQLRQMQIGVCLYPINFADWAQSADVQKLAVGWPSKPAAQSSSALASQLAKTSASLQSLKSKYNIDDGDADMQVLKGLVASMQTPGQVPAAAAVGPAAPAALQSAPAMVSAQPVGGDGALPHDVAQVERYMQKGLGAGLQQEIHDTIWNMEHIEHRLAATNLLSGIMWVIALYLGIGGFFRFQQGARGWDLCPHAPFWAEYPRLVADGARYAKILAGLEAADDARALSGGVVVGRGLEKRSGSGSFDPL